MKTKLNALLKATKEKFSLPAVSLSVLHQGKEYHLAQGLAHVEKNIAATPDTIYCIASSTKAFIATALNILAQKGKLDLDAPVKDVLPWFQMHDPYMSENLTPRDALSHRSGLPRHDLSWLNNPERTTKELIEALRYLPPAFKPRYRFHYQNHMFVLATLLVETITKQHWSQFVSEHVWQPLGMTSTYASGNLIDNSNINKARPYALREGKIEGLPYNYIVNVGGAGSIYSTTRDMLKWLKFRLEGQDTLLCRERLDDMHTPQMIIKEGEMSPLVWPGVDFTNYGQGWFIESYRGNKLVHHGGTIDGFKSEQLFLPDQGIGISILCNLNGTQAMTSLGYKVIDLLLGLEAWDWDDICFTKAHELEASQKEKARATIAAAKAKATEGAALSDYQGLFRHPAYGDLVFKVIEGQLLASFIGREMPMIYAGGDEFVLLEERRGLALPVTFLRENGSVYALDVPLEEMVKDIAARFIRQ